MPITEQIQVRSKKEYFDLVYRSLFDWWLSDTNDDLYMETDAAKKCFPEYIEYIEQYEKEAEELKKSGNTEWIQIMKDKTKAAKQDHIEYLKSTVMKRPVTNKISKENNK